MYKYKDGHKIKMTLKEQFSEDPNNFLAKWFLISTIGGVLVVILLMGIFGDKRGPRSTPYSGDPDKALKEQHYRRLADPDGLNRHRDGY